MAEYNSTNALGPDPSNEKTSTSSARALDRIPCPIRRYLFLPAGVFCILFPIACVIALLLIGDCGEVWFIIYPVANLIGCIVICVGTLRQRQIVLINAVFALLWTVISITCLYLVFIGLGSSLSGAGRHDDAVGPIFLFVGFIALPITSIISVVNAMVCIVKGPPQQSPL